MGSSTGRLNKPTKHRRNHTLLPQLDTEMVGQKALAPDTTSPNDLIKIIATLKIPPITTSKLNFTTHNAKRIPTITTGIQENWLVS
jgi:hypothetical protein